MTRSYEASPCSCSRQVMTWRISSSSWSFMGNATMASPGGVLRRNPLCAKALASAAASRLKIKAPIQRRVLPAEVIFLRIL